MLETQTITSPFLASAQQLIEMGYHVLPVKAAEKFPAIYTGNKWWGMKDWQRFKDRQPTRFELEIWCDWPDANIGVVLGSPIGDDQLIAVDIDTNDSDIIDDIQGAMPRTRMVKRGSKGLTLFFRAPHDIKTKRYNVNSERLVDLLTGHDTTQTVMPHSIHPDGMAYQYIAGPVGVHDLPFFGTDQLEELEETLSSLGWDPNEQRRPVSGREHLRVIEGGASALDSPFGDLNAEALKRLDDWVPHLPLFNLERARGGYACVATWRSSGSGRPDAERKRNLSIQPNGIKDFGTDHTYSAIDVVMAARGVDFDNAFVWLSETLHGVAGTVIANQLKTSAIIEDDNSEHNVCELPGGIPEALCFPPGIVGAISHWIVGTSSRPQPQLALAAALSIAGTVMGRQYAGPTRTGTHLYTLTVAPTGSGKNHPLECAKRILAACGMGENLGPGEFISHSAVISFMTRSPIGLCVMDEFGSFMARINHRRAGGFEKAVGGIMRTAWGSSFSPMPTPEWAQKRSQLIHAPALSVLGASTQEEFFAALSGMDAQNGVLNRFLVFANNERPNAVDPSMDYDAVPTEIIEGLKLIREGAAGPYTSFNLNQSDVDPGDLIARCGWGEGAKEIYTAYQQEIEQRGDDDMDFAASHSRAAEYAQRLALIRAVGIRGGQTDIDQVSMQWGIDIVRACFGYVHEAAQDYIADTEAQSRAQEIMRIIKKRKGRATHRDVMQLLKNKYQTRDVKDALLSLTESGTIEVLEQANSRGKPTVIYRLP